MPLELTAEEAAVLCDDLVTALVTHTTSSLLDGAATGKHIETPEFYRQGLALCLSVLKMNGVEILES